MNRLSIKVLGFDPVVGDGLLYVGDSWQRIAPSMETYAVDMLVRENERLRAIVDEAWSFFCAVTDDVPLLKSYKDSDHA